MAENIKELKAHIIDPDVIRIDKPYAKEGGIAILRGNLAPDGAVVKQSAVAPEMMVRDVTARVFNSEEEGVEAILGGKIKKGDVVVIRPLRRRGVRRAARHRTRDQVQRRKPLRGYRPRFQRACASRHVRLVPRHRDFPRRRRA